MFSIINVFTCTHAHGVYITNVRLDSPADLPISLQSCTLTSLTHMFSHTAPPACSQHSHRTLPTSTDEEEEEEEEERTTGCFNILMS